MINVLFFAQVRELLGCSKLSVEPSAEIHNADTLREHLARKNDKWAKVMASDKLLVAINQELCPWDMVISDGDEIAFFPPVTGG
ncbi:molybdopterin synthase sulfur carrier subunit [Parashewanella spongiae]|uniref:Molybdopterin synthase sulfur carrier subunit n=1 Tax=Parashewanella spongiae TaxID=342950 RepID=A0A3A6TRY8_9GAMM|nr:molybdopterin synthase sulfur carrier subunit [Parashewanella spongiae]MCL1078065.1 molybdopterin synthase sulfur carrier subunit [Parashewanella spongiae]RJY16939.1 molybdopterin synthase sulfur carrier subunit [Parashewanella spongiae]